MALPGDRLGDAGARRRRRLGRLPAGRLLRRARARCASPTAPTRCTATRSPRSSSASTAERAPPLSRGCAVPRRCSCRRQRLPGAGRRLRPADRLVAARARRRAAPRRRRSRTARPRRRRRSRRRWRAAGAGRCGRARSSARTAACAAAASRRRARARGRAGRRARPAPRAAGSRRRRSCRAGSASRRSAIFGNITSQRVSSGVASPICGLVALGELLEGLASRASPAAARSMQQHLQVGRQAELHAHAQLVAARCSGRCGGPHSRRQGVSSSCAVDRRSRVPSLLALERVAALLRPGRDASLNSAPSAAAARTSS